jgi:putative tryptophan/tyrosine transport system substrate-binding protein
MRRRDFISGIAGSTGWLLTARAQEPGRTYRIGFLTPVGRESYAPLFDELRLNGFIEGQNLLVIPGSFGVPNDQLATVAASIIAASPDVIVGGPSLPLLALKRATQTIPVVGLTEDMVGDGLVDSLARPSGNITGVSLLSPELDGKRQEILIEAVPGVKKIAVFADSHATRPEHLQKLLEQAHSRSVEVLTRSIVKKSDVISAIREIKASGAQGINFLATPMFSLDNADLIEQVTSSHLPSIYQWPEDAEGGAQLAYGPRFTDIFRERARMVVKILRGIKPADIPVEQPTKFELVINLKTAKAIGVDVSASLVARADKLIE